jgi:hypothetical protein
MQMRNVPRTPLVRPSKLLWLPLAAPIVLGLWLYGTPHMLWSYHYTGRGGDKFYLDCFYVGRDSQLVVPHDGKCPFIALLKPGQGRL